MTDRQSSEVVEIAQLTCLPTTIRQLLSGDQTQLIGTECTVQGWVKTRRDQEKGALLFFEVQDGTCTSHVQVLAFKKDYDEETFERLSKISTGYSIKAVGKFVESPAKGQYVEMVSSSIKILGECPKDYVLQKHSSKSKGPAFETLRKVPHLRCRALVFQSTTRIRDRLMRATHDLFGSEGFVWAATPIITFSDCEGAGEAFLVKTEYPKDQLPEGGFFGQDAYLTVSGQLEGEMMATAHSRIYTFGPTFRAEKSKTTRHAAEFWMVEPEVCFIELQELIQLACAYVKRCIFDVTKYCLDDLKQTWESRILSEGVPKKQMFKQRKQRLDTLQHYIQKPFVVISYTEAIDVLAQHQQQGKIFEEAVQWGMDMSSEHEKYLTDVVYKSPVVVYGYPAAIKAFYMKRYTPEEEAQGIGDSRCVQAFDLLVPGIGELIGGSIREHSEEKLVQVMTEKGMDLEKYQPYIDLRVHGTVPHGGFGLGFERLIQFVSGMHHIRDVLPFPRAY